MTKFSQLTGELLSSKQRNDAIDYLLQKDPNFVTVAYSFLAKDETVFPKASLNEVVMKETHPTSWWLNVKHQESIPDRFVDLISPMYQCPSSTASVERVFSTYGFIQTDTRNRLTQDKVMKLTFCFRALRKDDPNFRVNRKRKLISNETQNNETE